MVVGAVAASPCSAFEIAKDSREENDGRCWRRGVCKEKEDDREFMALFLVNSYFWSYQVIQSMPVVETALRSLEGPCQSAAASVNGTF